MKNNTFEEIWNKLKESKNIIIPLHPKPDGDSLGSCVALKYVLEKNTKAKVTVVSFDDLADDIKTFDFSKEVQFGKKIESYNLENFDCLVFLDHGSLQGYPEGFQKRNFVVNIDHHQTNSKYGNINYVDTQRISCCSILFDFFKKVGINFDRDLARRLLLGILTDSYFFVNGDSIDAMRKALYLLEIGKIDYPNEFFRPITNRKWGLKKYEGILLGNMQKTNVDGKVIAYSFAKKEDVKKCNLNPAEIRLGISFLKDTSDIDLFFTVTELEDGIKGSFRSTQIDTSLFAQRLGGGGHKAASAFVLEKMPIEKAIETTLKTIKEVGIHKI